MKRFFLFLQGPVGPFFRTLGRILVDERQQVARVNFNGGDVYDWNGPETIILREKARDWPAVLSDLIRKYGITDLLTFGDCRPQLRHATVIAKAEGVRCHVFEEGYLRPDWITMEENGVNGNSAMSKDPRWYIESAHALPRDNTVKLKQDSMRMLMYHSSVYHAAKFLAQPLFPYFRNHRPYSEREHVQRWVLKVLRMKNQARRDQAFQKNFISSGRQFFLFCLQLGSDYQIRRHSPFENMNTAIRNVLTSFARNLPDGIGLLVKSHPLEIWPSELEQFTLGLAEELGIEDRVWFTHGGNLRAYIDASRGMIAVNSTAGMESLGLKRPTIALGKAIYDIPGLTHGHDLESFWSNPIPPDPDLYMAFRRILINRTQANGSFYTSEGLRLAIPTVIKRLLGRGEWTPHRQHVRRSQRRLSTGPFVIPSHENSPAAAETIEHDR